jgi:hypothetical protein
MLFDRTTQIIQDRVQSQILAASHCDSSASLAETLSTISKNSIPEARTSALCARKFVVFAGRLEQYFDFLSVFVDVRLQWRQTVWGLMHIIFKVFLL